MGELSLNDLILKIKVAALIFIERKKLKELVDFKNIFFHYKIYYFLFIKS